MKLLSSLLSLVGLGSLVGAKPSRSAAPVDRSTGSNFDGDGDENRPLQPGELPVRWTGRSDNPDSVILRPVPAAQAMSHCVDKDGIVRDFTPRHSDPDFVIVGPRTVKVGKQTFRVLRRVANARDTYQVRRRCHANGHRYSLLIPGLDDFTALTAMAATQPS